MSNNNGYNQPNYGNGSHNNWSPNRNGQNNNFNQPHYGNGSNSNWQGNRNGNNNNGQIFKRSGAVYTIISNKNGGHSKFEGNTIVNAWRSTKFGLMRAVVAPYAGEGKKGLEVVNSMGKSGNEHKEYQKMLCTITNATMGTHQIYPVLMNVKTKVIVIKELSLCITPNGNGVTRKGKRVSGYFGTNVKR